MSYLKMALQALEAATAEKGHQEAKTVGFPDRVLDHPHPCHNFTSREKPANPLEHILTCAECPWYQVNPWTHYPDLPAWCAWHFDHLSEDNPPCIGYRRGEIPPRENP